MCGQGVNGFLQNAISSSSDPIANPNAYKPGGINASDANVVAQKGGIIFNTLSTLGIIVAVITIIVIGIKYMVGSVEQKAEYKKTMIPYLVGAAMIMGISTILGVFSGIMENLG